MSSASSHHSSSHGDLSVKSAPYGKLSSGEAITAWTLSHNAKGGVAVTVIDYGAIIVSVMQPDAKGDSRNVVLGYDHLEAWVSGKPWFNSLVGRHANRIKAGLFHLNGETYQLEQNNHGNHLHGGAAGFNAKVMQSRVLPAGKDEASHRKFVGVEMKFVSPHLEAGYPGELEVTTCFRLYADNTLEMSFAAELTPQSPAGISTIVNLCNHAYWNLNGSEGKEGILQHTLRLNARSITELDGKETMLTTGRILPVIDTPYDFTARPARTIGGPQMDALDKILPAPAGYDLNFVLNKDHGQAKSPEEDAREVTLNGQDVLLSFAARLADPASGRVMDVYTTAPGIQCYTGNFLDGSSLVGRGGVAYEKHAAVCLETQSFPDAINHADAPFKDYPRGILAPGEKYLHVVQHRFSTVKA